MRFIKHFFLNKKYILFQTKQKNTTITNWSKYIHIKILKIIKFIQFKHVFSQDAAVSSVLFYFCQSCVPHSYDTRNTFVSIANSRVALAPNFINFQLLLLFCFLIFFKSLHVQYDTFDTFFQLLICLIDLD